MEARRATWHAASALLLMHVNVDYIYDDSCGLVEASKQLAPCGTTSAAPAPLPSADSYATERTGTTKPISRGSSSNFPPVRFPLTSNTHTIDVTFTIFYPGQSIVASFNKGSDHVNCEIKWKRPPYHWWVTVGH